MEDRIGDFIMLFEWLMRDSNKNVEFLTTVANNLGLALKPLE